MHEETTPDLVVPGQLEAVTANRVSACQFSSGAPQRSGPRRKGRSLVTLARRAAEKDERAYAEACLMSRPRNTYDSSTTTIRRTIGSASSSGAEILASLVLLGGAILRIADDHGGCAIECYSR